MKCALINPVLWQELDKGTSQSDATFDAAIYYRRHERMRRRGEEQRKDLSHTWQKGKMSIQEGNLSGNPVTPLEYPAASEIGKDLPIVTELPRFSTVTSGIANVTSPIVIRQSSGQDSLLENLIIPLYGTIFFLSIVGNSLVLITLAKNKRMRTVTNVYLLNLVSVWFNSSYHAHNALICLLNVTRQCPISRFFMNEWMNRKHKIFLKRLFALEIN